MGNAKGKTGEVTIEVQAPRGWTVSDGDGKLELPEEDRTDLSVEIATPELGKEELRHSDAQEVLVRAIVEGKPIGEVRMKVELKANALAQ